MPVRRGSQLYSMGEQPTQSTRRRRWCWTMAGDMQELLIGALHIQIHWQSYSPSEMHGGLKIPGNEGALTLDFPLHVAIIIVVVSIALNSWCWFTFFQWITNYCNTLLSVCFLLVTYSCCYY